MDQDEFDFNDMMFGLNEQPRPQVVSISNDSNFPSSISGVGIDANNPEENANYVEENHQRQEVIFAVGLANGNVQENLEKVDSGLASSISKTRSSEFVPEIIEILKTYSSTNKSEIKEDPCNDFDAEMNVLEHEVDRLSQSDNTGNKENYVSSFDLALEKGYRDQAKIYFDDAVARGLCITTSHVKKLKDMKNEEKKENIVKQEGYQKLEQDFWSESLTIQNIKMLEIDFYTYLECIQKNQFKKVLRIIDKKKIHNEVEKQIRNNIKSKEKRLKLKNQTIDLINKEITNCHAFAQQINEFATTRRKEKLLKKIEIYKKLLEDENLPHEKKVNFQEQLQRARKEEYDLITNPDAVATASLNKPILENSASQNNNENIV